MQLSTHTDYALRTLIYLAIKEWDHPVTVQEISKHYGISSNHVAKVAQTLAQLRYIKSVRGRGGGLVLAQAAQQINVGKLVRQTENLTLLECFTDDPPCPIAPACKLKSILKKAQQAFLEELDQYTLSDLTGNEKELYKLIIRSKPAS